MNGPTDPSTTIYDSHLPVHRVRKVLTRHIHEAMVRTQKVTEL